METNIQANLLQIKAELIEGMREYMNDVVEDGGDPGYTESDIGKSEAILDNFLAKIHVAPAGGTDSVMLAVKDAVLALNALNESCDYSLIETEQREEICELIIQGAAAVGVGSGEDITEEWREW